MIFRYLLRLAFIFVVVLSGKPVDAQQKITIDKIQGYFKEKFKDNDGIFLANEGTISSIANSYCSEDAYVDIVPDSWHPSTTSIEWKIMTYYGVQEFHPDWADIIGSGQSTVLRFYPNRVVAPYFGLEIYFEYTQRNSLNLQTAYNYDYTYVYKTPAVFNFGVSPSECLTGSVNLVLSGSESGMQYQLRRDGVNVGVAINGTGNSITFSANQTGVYTVRARNITNTTCDKDMNGSVTIYDLPTVNILSNSPVCVGQTLNLDATPGMVNYSWSGPASFTSNISNPSRANVTTAMAGIYSVLVTDNNGCQNTATTNVVVNPRPTAVISGSTTICRDDNATITINLTGQQPFNFTYTDGTTPVTISNHSSNVYTFSVSPASTTTYTLTSLTDNNSCGALSGDLTGSAVITVNQRPTSVLSGGPVTTCDGTPVNLSVALTGVAPWSITYTDGVGTNTVVANASPYILSVSPSATSTYSVVALTDATTCSAVSMTGTATVTVNPRPTAILSIDGATTLCNGGSTDLRFSFTGLGPWNLTYTANGVPQSVTTNSNPYIVTVNPIATTVYRTTALSDSRCTAIASDFAGDVTVTVNPRPTGALTGATTICNGETTQLSIALTGAAPWNITYTVAGAPVTVNGVNSSPYTFNVSPSTTTTYQLTAITDANGCSAQPIDLSSNAIVTVNSRPTAVISGNATLCNGGNSPVNIALTGTGPWTFVVAANGVPIPAINTVLSSYNLTVSPSVSTTYTLVSVVDNGTGCSAQPGDLSGSAVVNINPRPTVVFGSDATICHGSSTNLTLNLTGAAPWNVTYSFNGTPSNIVVAGPSPYLLNVSPTPGVTVYKIESLTDNNGCVATPTDISGQPVVTVNARPTSVISGTATICDGSSTNLSVTLTGTGPWNYTYSDGTQSFNGTTNSAVFTIPVTPNSSRTYTITALSDATGCTAWPVDMTGSAVITVNARPTGSVSIVGLDEFCNGGNTSVRFDLNGSGLFNLTYSINGVQTTVNGITSPYILPQSPSTTSVYQIVALNDANCAALPGDISGSVTVTVHPRPTSTISGNTTICNGESATISFALTGTPAWHIEYEANGATQIVNNMLSSSFDVSVAPSTTTTYQVTRLIDGNGCEALAADMPGTAVVTVNQRPTGTLSGDATVCAGTPTDLVFNLSGNAPFTIFYSANGVPQSVGGINVNNYLLSVTPLVNTTYIFTGLSDANCAANAGLGDISGTASVTVTPRPTGVISGNSTICIGETTSFNVSLTGSQPWSVTYSDGTTNYTVNGITTSPAVINVNPTATTTYTLVSISDATGCNSITGDLSGSAVVNVNPLPTATISGGGTICNGSSIGLTVTFTGSGPWDFSYSDGTTTTPVSGVGSPYTLNVSPSISSVYTLVSAVDLNGCNAVSLSGSANVVMNPRPTAVLSGSQNICLGQTANLNVVLTGTAPWNITYSDGTTSASIVAGSSPFSLPVTPGTTSTFTITGLSDATGCVSTLADLTGSATVTVNQVSVNMAVLPPASPIGTNVCYGNTLTYQATPSLGSGTYTYQYELRQLPAGAWNPVGTGTNNYTTLTTLDVGNYEIRVTVTDNVTTCFVTSAVSGFEVLALPTVSMNISDTDVCLNDLITITVLPAGYVNYTFTIDGVDINNGVNNVFTTNSLTVGTHNVYVAVNNGACTNSTVVEQIEVRPLPMTALVLDNPTRTTVCISEPVNFTASGADEYQFYVNGAPYGPRSATATLNYSSATNFNVYVIGYNAFGCELQSNTINVTVSQPVAGLSVNPNRPEHCANETLRFTATGGVSYQFFYNNNPQAPGTPANEFVLFPPINGDEIYVVVTDGFGCQATSATRTLIVNPTPVITLTSDDDDDIICEGETVLFTATPNVNFYYRFFIIRGGLDILVQEGSSNTYSTSALLNGDQVYVIVRDEKLCNSISPSISLTVNPNPVVTLTVLPSSHIGEGESIQVVAGGADEYLFQLNGNPVGVWTTYDTWDFATPQNGDIVSVIGRNAFGCEIEHPGITIQVDALPLEFELRAVSDTYCANEPGVQLYLTGYESDVNYLLIDISTGVEVPFGLGSLSGGIITWTNVREGTYFVRATRTTGVGTTRDFTTQVTVVEYPIPLVFNLSPDATITECYGGINISLDGSENGFNYSLLLNNSMTIETIVGDGNALNFQPVYFSGNYTIIAENPVTGCINIMNGSTIVNAPANSNIYNFYSVPANGRYCPGSTGVDLWLDGSDLNVTYALYRDNIEIGTTINGTGNPLLVVTVTEPGVYMVMVAAQGGCIAPMNGSVTVIADPLPTAFAVTADNNGSFCPGSAGVKIRIAAQQLDVVYTLWYNGVAQETKTGMVNDPALALEFDGYYNTPGVYSVTGELPGGCQGFMANTVTLVVDQLPADFSITTDPGSGFCTGESTNIYLNGSQPGVNYELFRDGIGTGTILSGNGGLLTFNVNQEGNYTIEATFTTTPTACSVFMTGSATITEIPYPDINTNVTTDLTGTDCDTGAPVTIENSEVGVVYELLKDDNGTLVATGIVVVGDGNDIVFPELIVDKDATYRVSARRSACEVILNASVYIDVPGAVRLFSITGNGDVCIGDLGGTLGLSGSEIGVSYQLYSVGTGVGGTDAPVKTAINGDGNALNFGLIASEGDYYIVGTSIDCSRRMLGTFNLRFNPLPIAFQMTGSGIYCSDTEGARIGLNSSEIGVNYKLLWFNGSFNQLMDEIDGVGLPLYFSGQFNDGDYTVYARNNLTGCTSSMNGQITVTRHPEPDVTGITVTMDATTYCSFEGGVEVGLTNGEVGVTYSVVDQTSGVVIQSETRTSTGSFVIGIIPAGTYRIEASRSGECIVTVATDIVITEEPSPVVYDLTGPASGCASSIVLTLSGSEAGVVYQLYSDAMMIPGNEDGYVAGYDQVGTGSALTFNLTGFASGASFFWVKAGYTGGCSSLTDWTLVNVRQAATIFDVELPNGNEYCANLPGVSVGVSITDVGVGYQLIRGGNTVDFIEGNGSARMFGLPHGTGTYFVRARHFESGCYFDSDPFTVLMNPMPAIFNISSGGSVNDHEIIVDGSETGVQYYLYHNGVEVAQDPLDGDGDILNFGTVSITGNYQVLGVGVGGCSSWMNGTTIIFETPLVAVPDTLYLRKGQLVGEINVGDNDFFLPGVDLRGVNITFQITGPDPLGEVSLDLATGLLVYQKLPTFYGKDSLTYVITNTDIPSRASAAKVYIVVGNKDFGDDMSFLLPNAFSPNGDGINDYFVISGLGTTEESSLEVFNRWGTIVYRSKGNKYENNWDGRSNIGAMVSIGSELPNGTYYYIFKVKKNVEGKVVTRKYNGYIELRR